MGIQGNTGCTWVYRVYMGIQGIQGIHGYTGYTGYTWVYKQTNKQTNKTTLLISSKRLFSLIYNVKYLKLSFPKIPLKNAVLFLL